MRIEPYVSLLDLKSEMISSLDLGTQGTIDITDNVLFENKDLIGFINVVCVFGCCIWYLDYIDFSLSLNVEENKQKTLLCMTDQLLK